MSNHWLPTYLCLSCTFWAVVGIWGFVPSVHPLTACLPTLSVLSIRGFVPSTRSIHWPPACLYLSWTFWAKYLRFCTQYPLHTPTASQPMFAEQSIWGFISNVHPMTASLPVTVLHFLSKVFEPHVHLSTDCLPTYTCPALSEQSIRGFGPSIQPMTASLPIQYTCPACTFYAKYLRFCTKYTTDTFYDFSPPQSCWRWAVDISEVHYTSEYHLYGQTTKWPFQKKGRYNRTWCRVYILVCMLP